MAWNPEVYDQFKTERSAPFFDLLALLKPRPGLEALDLGCGTGELTQHLAAALPESTVLGIDSSQEMLEKSKAFAGKQLHFACVPIEKQLADGRKWDVIFSNAALQWVQDHTGLFEQLAEAVRPGGQLLVQMPNQHQNISNRLLNELAARDPYEGALAGWNRISPVLSIEAYSQLLFELGAKSMNVFEKVYPLILADVDALIDWVSGTALIPYLEKLEGELKGRFKEDYRQFLNANFTHKPVFYPFKRILIEATF